MATLLRRGAARLRHLPTPRLDAELLLAHALGCARTALYSAPERSVPADAQAGLQGLLARRAAGEPMAYILGRREFYGLQLACDRRALVPRPETELLVDNALALALPRRARVLDLGCGSGALALALASRRRGWRISGSDRCPRALALARGNGRRLGLRIRWHIGNWLQGLGRFDLIVGNPPYLDASEAALGDPHSGLPFEPRGALVPGPGAGAALCHIMAAAPGHLRRRGWLLLEHGADQGPWVRRRLRLHGYRRISQHHDLAGLCRMSAAQVAQNPHQVIE